MSSRSLQEALHLACAEVGAVPKDVPADGKFHRLDLVDDSHGKSDGSIMLFTDGQGGIVNNFKGETKTFFVDDGRTLSDEERQERDSKRQAAMAKAQEEIARSRKRAANKAKNLWQAATPAHTDHPYLEKKQVSPTDTLREIDPTIATGILGYPPRRGDELLTGRLLVASIKAGTNFTSAELIDEAGRKVSVKDGAVSGGYWAAQPFPKSSKVWWATMLIGEGVATVLSAKEATKYPAVAARYCSNLPAVARAMKAIYPKTKLVILSDIGNGQADAERAALAVGGVLVVPKFTTEDVETFTTTHGKAPSDFNDLAVLKGLEVVRAQIDTSVNSRGDQNHQTSYSKTDRYSGKRETHSVSLFDEEGKKKSQSTILIELAAQWEVFHDADNVGYIIIKRDAIREVWPIRSTAFRQWLSSAFYDLTDKGCNSNAVADALNTIEARANKADKSVVYLRVARTGGNLYLDLCDNRWRVIEISADGWQILDKSPVYFVRKNGMLPLPIPEKGGNVEDLRRFLNIEADGFHLTVGWLIGTLRGEGDYAVLVLQGEQGTGKSTVSKVVRAFVDPSTVPLRSPPREVRDLLVSAINNHLVVLDNLSGLQPEVSDCLCRLATGGGHDARALFTDTDQVLVDIQRPVLVNGIDDIATRPDLSERSIVLKLPVIDPTNRKDKRTFWADFDVAKPKIMGALLDALSCALRREPFVDLPRKPRMADFAIWVTAAEPALGWESGAFMKVYDKNQNEAVEIGIDASPVGSTLLELLEFRGGSWTGKPTELLNELTNRAGLLAKSKAWPQSPKGLKNILHRLAPSLRRLGVEVTDGMNGIGHRFYKITHCPLQPTYPTYVTEPAPDNGSSTSLSTSDRKSTSDRESKVTSHSDLGTSHAESYVTYQEPHSGADYVGYVGYVGYPAQCPVDDKEVF